MIPHIILEEAANIYREMRGGGGDIVLSPHSMIWAWGDIFTMYT